MNNIKIRIDLTKQECLICLGKTNILYLSNVPKVQIENNILNTSQYSSSDWRKNLNSTTAQQNHGSDQFNLNLLMNPEIAKKQNNIRSTQISEYSNAKHNNTVFVNPKNTSC